ncbi:ABC transporter substrate-binding protein [Microbacterium rhizosphaerae]|uniref:ABC transporter substrate-binding protein n=1 Tax=Microbacterium rhizosphaerae TaxID=1678237 RepID=A0ABZ0SJ98_9MICO|nr:ABC transporter substrate-binding protein [Microbacterium rhizosphaerae]WPR89444.1 ABC transporter substrate-binding protein [Microbacterium rhizosphaerae]
MLAAISALVVLAGCASVTPTKASDVSGFTPVAQDGKAALNVLVDPTRQAAVEAYQKAHPDVKLTVETFDGTGLQAKMSLYDKSGSGWPDVVFSPATNDVAWASKSSGSGAQPYAAPLNQKLIPQSTLDGWATGSLAPCQSNGNTYCLRNDLAQTVTWYNKTLFDQWGYAVPKTWEDFQALGLKVAKEHPGYLVGQFGDPNALDVYFWASRCPAQETTDKPDTLKVNTSTPECTKMAKLLDTLLDAGVMGKQSYFEKGLDGSKVLMAVGPSWFGKYLFDATYKTPAGRIGVADQPQWAGESTASNGNVGGGVWMVSSHSKNLKAATDLVTWATSDAGFQKSAPTYPANKAAATAWLTNPENIAYFATDVKAPLQTAADQVWKGWAFATFSDQDPFKNVILTGINAGKSVTSLLPDWQTEITNTAKAAGYKVVQ